MTTAQWYGDKDNQALVNERNGRVVATIGHDGHGKYAVTIFPSLLSPTFWLLLKERLCQSWALLEYPRFRFDCFAWLWSLRLAGFPFIRIRMGDQKERHAAAVRVDVERMFSLDMYRGREREV